MFPNLASGHFSRIRLRGEVMDEANEQPGVLSFEKNIRPLFRERDRGAMKDHFDLWSRDDVAEHSEAILGVLESGQMPCDRPWPQDQVSLFRRWVESGMTP
jgi:hypothetical protein